MTEPEWKPCRYRGRISHHQCECSNHRDLVHSGTVSNVVCVKCPFAKPHDFFSQTGRLYVELQQSGKYIPPPKKSCGGCRGGAEAAGPPMQFVWPYWDGGANGDELRFSIRSVHEFYDGNATCTIIGDRPAWWRGHVIEQKRVPNGTPNQAFRDTIAKLWTMATHPEMMHEFVWMMDDVYFLKPVTKGDLMTPRAQRWVDTEHNSWARRKKTTIQALQAIGASIWDYSTHAPHYAEKEKVRDIYERFNMHQQTLLWEVLYGNLYRGRPENVVPWLHRLYTKQAAEDIGRITARSTVLNNIDGSWCEGLRSFLASRLPVPSPGELEHAGIHFKIARQRKNVRRGVRRGPFKKVPT